MDNTPDFEAGYVPKKVWTDRKTGYIYGVPVWGGYVDSTDPADKERYIQEQKAKYYSPYGYAQRAYTGAISNQNNILNRLQSLLRDPSQVQQTAGYKFALDQGNQAINRSAAAKGMLNSGNVLAELAKYGQGMASNEFQNQVNNLGSLANQYSGQAGQAGQFLASANSGPYQVAGLNPDAPSYYSRQGWW